MQNINKIKMLHRQVEFQRGKLKHINYAKKEKRNAL